MTSKSIAKLAFFCFSHGERRSALLRRTASHEQSHAGSSAQVFVLASILRRTGSAVCVRRERSWSALATRLASAPRPPLRAIEPGQPRHPRPAPRPRRVVVGHRCGSLNMAAASPWGSPVAAMLLSPPKPRSAVPVLSSPVKPISRVACDADPALLVLSGIESRILDEMHLADLPEPPFFERHEVLHDLVMDWLPWEDCMRARRVSRAWLKAHERCVARMMASPLARDLTMSPIEAGILQHAALPPCSPALPPVPELAPALGPMLTPDPTKQQEAELWECGKDPRGFTFAKNVTTGDLVWTCPDDQVGDWDAYADESGSRCYYNRRTGVSYCVMDGASNVFAAQDWSQFVDRDGKLYVYHHDTGDCTPQSPVVHEREEPPPLLAPPLPPLLGRPRSKRRSKGKCVIS